MKKTDSEKVNSKIDFELERQIEKSTNRFFKKSTITTAIALVKDPSKVLNREDLKATLIGQDTKTPNYIVTIHIAKDKLKDFVNEENTVYVEGSQHLRNNSISSEERPTTNTSYGADRRKW